MLSLSTLRLLRRLCYAVLLVVGVALLLRERELLPALVFEHGAALATIWALSALLLVTQSLNFAGLLEGGQLRFGPHWVHLWAVANLSNYVAPFQPGLVVRTAVLKSWGADVREALATTLRQLQLSAWLGCLLAGAALWLLGLPGWSLLGAGLLAAAVLWWALMHRLRPGTGVAPVPGWRWLRVVAAPPGARQLLLLACNYALGALNVWAAHASFGSELGVAEALLIAAVLTVSGMLALLPANLGVQELILWLSADLTGLDGEAAIAVAVMFRVAHILAGVSVAALTYPWRRLPAGGYRA